ncbi:beta subunit of N-acylethanolamine-hydrolyzing acid amidase-domain-containing protein [Parachaetomium inaequale]|uniref:ceramidase n=1 Tax=Parachaetomium inaequale TaxID=2588326 RepID=A0AAN6SNF5_9PEZI|nr:beta subunit of N-acylethanolamine-hydrolyzing acid amidase-domain-containing protein [Parachaetomium inaequale]
MESAGLRRRQREQDAKPPANPARRNPGSPPTHPPAQTGNKRTLPSQFPSTQRNNALPNSLTTGYTPPLFIINLSLPPSHRYTHVAAALKPALASTNFEALFAEAIALVLPAATATPSHGLLNITALTTRSIRLLSRLLLRRMYSDEETAELRGISLATGLGMDLLVAFNVALDLLMGCTSGGVRLQESAAPGGGSRMVHFRTLDWDMDELRRLVVELEFVRVAGGPVVARTVGYFGYVGVLTGVREGLSVSLNFRVGGRGERDWWRRWALRWHLGMVLLGKRRGVSSVLRGYLLGDGGLGVRRGWWPWSAKGRRYVELDGDDPGLPDVDLILADLACSPSTAAYLVFCTPSEVYSVEKGYRTASSQRSGEFLTTCNHDVADEPDPGRIHAATQKVASPGMADIIDESFERKQAVEHVWKQRLRLRRKAHRHRREQVEGVNLEDVLHLLGHEYITYGGTHYAVIMDPEEGEIMWRRAYRTEDLRVEDENEAEAEDSF